MNRYLLALMLVFTGFRAANAETYVVSPNFPGTIQALIDFVVTDGDVIQLEAGTYLIDAPIDPKGLAITLRGVQDPSSNTPLTILDGQFKTRLVDCDSAETADTIFEAIEFSRGGNFGAFRASNASPTIVSCVFYLNTSEGGEAGGVTICGDSIIRDTRFDDNRGPYGALYFCGGSRGVVERCSFVRNQSTASFGAGAIFAPSSVQFVNCKICENDAPQTRDADFEDSTITELCGCLADTNYDNNVDGTDIGVLFALWGTSNPLADFNKDGIADGIDLGILVAAWGDCPPF